MTTRVASVLGLLLVAAAAISILLREPRRTGKFDLGKDIEKNETDDSIVTDSQFGHEGIRSERRGAHRSPMRRSADQNNQVATQKTILIRSAAQIGFRELYTRHGRGSELIRIPVDGVLGECRVQPAILGEEVRIAGHTWTPVTGLEIALEPECLHSFNVAGQPLQLRDWSIGGRLTSLAGGQALLTECLLLGKTPHSWSVASNARSILDFAASRKALSVQLELKSGWSATGYLALSPGRRAQVAIPERVGRRDDREYRNLEVKIEDADESSAETTWNWQINSLFGFDPATRVWSPPQADLELKAEWGELSFIEKDMLHPQRRTSSIPITTFEELIIGNVYGIGVVGNRTGLIARTAFVFDGRPIILRPISVPPLHLELLDIESQRPIPRVRTTWSVMHLEAAQEGGTNPWDNRDGATTDDRGRVDIPIVSQIPLDPLDPAPSNSIQLILEVVGFHEETLTIHRNDSSWPSQAYTKIHVRRRSPDLRVYGLEVWDENFPTDGYVSVSNGSGVTSTCAATSEVFRNNDYVDIRLNTSDPESGHLSKVLESYSTDSATFWSTIGLGEARYLGMRRVGGLWGLVPIAQYSVTVRMDAAEQLARRVWLSVYWDGIAMHLGQMQIGGAGQEDDYECQFWAPDSGVSIDLQYGTEQKASILGSQRCHIFPGVSFISFE